MKRIKGGGRAKVLLSTHASAAAREYRAVLQAGEFPGQPRSGVEEKGDLGGAPKRGPVGVCEAAVPARPPWDWAASPHRFARPLRRAGERHKSEVVLRN